MAELVSSPISDRVRAGMEAAKEKAKHRGWPATPDAVKDEIRRLARETDLSIRKIKKALSADVSRGVVGRVVKDVRSSGS